MEGHACAEALCTRAPRFQPPPASTPLHADRSFTALARLAAAAGDGLRALELAEELVSAGVQCKLRAFRPALVAFSRAVAVRGRGPDSSAGSLGGMEGWKLGQPGPAQGWSGGWWERSGWRAPTHASPSEAGACGLSSIPDARAGPTGPGCR